MQVSPDFIVRDAGHVLLSLLENAGKKVSIPSSKNNKVKTIFN